MCELIKLLLMDRLFVRVLLHPPHLLHRSPYGHLQHVADLRVLRLLLLQDLVALDGRYLQAVTHEDAFSRAEDFLLPS